MRTILGPSAFLLLLALLSGCSSVQLKRSPADGETVEAEGWAPIDRNDISGTKNRALADAQKKAVEKAAGVFLAASTLVEAAITSRQKILTDTQGRIRRYEVLDEKTEGGFLKIRIRAFVLRRQSEEKNTMFSSPPLGAPRIDVRIVGKKSPGAEYGARASSTVRHSFTEHGFALVATSSGQTNHDPYLLVRGEAHAYPVLDMRLGSFHSSKARIKVEVIDPKTDGVVLEKSQEASALDLDYETASFKAIERAGSLVGIAVAQDLTAVLWKRF